MFVRWKRRKCGKDRPYDNYIDAVLVESYRDDGKVKQRFLKHLASIPDDPGFSWLLWKEVSKRLNEMNLDKADRDKIEKMIEKRFPKPTEGEQEKRQGDLMQVESVVTIKGTNGSQI